MASRKRAALSDSFPRPTMLALLLCVPAALPQEAPSTEPRQERPRRISVEGSVRSADGRHYDDVEVAESWIFGAGDSRALAPFALDGKLQFVGSVDVLDGTVTVVACARGGALAAMASVPVPEAAPGERPRVRGLELVLRPARRALARLFVPEPRPMPVGGRPLGAQPIEFLFLCDPGGAHVGTARARDGQLDVYLPPGEYTWWTYGTQVVDLHGSARMRAGPGIEDLGVLEFRLSRLAALQGEKAPEWKVAGAFGVERIPSLAELRGRWVLLAFLNSTDESSFERMLPRLFELQAELEPTERFALLALHGRSPTEAAEVEARWNGAVGALEPHRPPPIPLLLDTEGHTLSAYGVESYPSLVLIDPQGLVAGSADLGEIRAALRRELGAPPAERR